MKIYIAGKMEGLPNFNYAAFNAAEEKLKVLGYEVVNPVIIAKGMYGNRTDFDEDELEALIAEEVAQLVKCEAIYLLKGWTTSKGAKKELWHALGNGLKVFLEE